MSRNSSRASARDASYSVGTDLDYRRSLEHAHADASRLGRATLESQPLHMGFEDEPSPASNFIGSGGGHELRSGRRSQDAYTTDRGDTRTSGIYGQRNGTYLSKPEEQGDMSEALIRLKRGAYIRDAAVTGCFVLSWYLFATILSVYNKWMFSPDYYNFPYPLFVTMCHQIVQFGLAFAVRTMWPSLNPKERPKKEDYVTKVVPAAMTTGLDIGLSNLSLKTVTLTLYTMCKSSTLIFVLMFAFAFHLEVYSLRLVLVISCIALGVFLMVFNATTVSIPGIVMIFTASAMGGLRWALTQLAMHKKEMGMTNPFATIFWLAPIMAVTLGLVSLTIEGWIGMFEGDFFGGWKGVQTWGFILCPGAVAFAMVASEYYIIQRAGIVPLSIAGIFKEVSTIGIASWIFGDQLTTLNEVGVVITVCGIATYSYHKYQKSVYGVPDAHGPHTDHPSDGFVPLMGSEEEGTMHLARTRDRGFERPSENPYVLEDEDEVDERRHSHSRSVDSGQGDVERKGFPPSRDWANVRHA